MGGGRTAEGVAIYRRVNGKYERQVPYKNQLTDEKIAIKELQVSDKEKFINDEVERVREFLTLMDSMDEFDEEAIRKNADYKWRKEHGEMLFSEKVNEAKSKDELLQILREKYGKNNVSDSFVNDIDFKLAKRVVSTVNELEEQYPFMKGQVTGLFERREFIGDTEYDGDASATMSPFGGLYINKEYWNYDNPRLYSGSERGFHPPNRTPESTIAHEFGHAMLNYYYNLKAKHPEKLDSTPLETLAIISLPVELRRGTATRNQISEYAAYSMKEAFSEALADVYANGKDASPVSVAYVNTLVNQIKKIG